MNSIFVPSKFHKMDCSIFMLLLIYIFKKTRNRQTQKKSYKQVKKTKIFEKSRRNGLINNQLRCIL